MWWLLYYYLSCSGFTVASFAICCFLSSFIFSESSWIEKGENEDYQPENINFTPSNKSLLLQFRVKTMKRWFDFYMHVLVISIFACFENSVLQNLHALTLTALQMIDRERFSNPVWQTSSWPEISFYQCFYNIFLIKQNITVSINVFTRYFLSN